MLQTPNQTVLLSATTPLWWRTRIVPVVILVVTVPILTTAALLEADPSGLGTHRKLGLPACGVVRLSGLPCATCGYTTAFAHATDGDLWNAFLTQPAAACLALLTAAAAVVGLYALITGMPLSVLSRSLIRPRLYWIAGAVVLVSWLYKVLLVRGVI